MKKEKLETESKSEEKEFINGTDLGGNVTTYPQRSYM